MVTPLKTKTRLTFDASCSLSKTMSCKTTDSLKTSICERFKRHNCAFYPGVTDKMTYRPIKKVIPSRKISLTNCSEEMKSCSTGVIRNNKKFQATKDKKVTKSDMLCNKQKSVTDFCVKCGDFVCKEENEKNDKHNSKRPSYLHTVSQDPETQVSIDLERSKNKNVCNKKKLIQQHYKNENFVPSVSSVKGHISKNKNTILDPIKERTEVLNEDSSDPVIKIYSESVEEIGYLDPEDDNTIEDLKEFRKKNYFECHSAKSRISSKGSVTSLNDHKCVYRFYLNDRLFPVPLNTDHQNIIRCVECHLPLGELNSNLEDSINGTIQTKVKLGNDTQDMILMLPITKPLIVPQRRRVKNDKENVVYFGIVKLNCNGNSMFNRTLPNDSLALKYQKGYKEFVTKDTYQYEKLRKDDVIII